MLEPNELPSTMQLFPGLTERVYFQDPDTKEFWFHATSACDVLGYTNVTSALNLHCDEDEKFQEIWNGKATWFVSESGLYGLAMGAKNDVAKKFKRWLKHDLLPKLRAKGYYFLSATLSEQLEQKHHTLEQSQIENDSLRKELEKCNEQLIVKDQTIERITNEKIELEVGKTIQGKPVSMVKHILSTHDEDKKVIWQLNWKLRVSENEKTDLRHQNRELKQAMETACGILNQSRRYSKANELIELLTPAN